MTQVLIDLFAQHQSLKAVSKLNLVSVNVFRVWIARYSRHVLLYNFVFEKKEIIQKIASQQCSWYIHQSLVVLKTVPDHYESLPLLQIQFM